MCLFVAMMVLAGWGPLAAQAQVRVVGSDVHAVSPDDSPSDPASISMVAARNGSACGKVWITSTDPIGGLKATQSDLKGPDGTIPAAQVRVSYPANWESTSWSQGPDILLDSPSTEAPAGKAQVWISVKVPKDAKPGVYTGQLMVEAKGLSRAVVPVKLDVRDWTLPDPQNYRAWVELMEQPDTLAVDYNVPLWSQKHWEMIAKSLQLIADTGSRVIYVPLIARTNYGNAESMVRWIKKGDNQYEYDFSIVEKYLDAVEKNLGTPKIVMVYAWETYMGQLWTEEARAPVEVKGAEGSYEWREAMAHNNLIENKNRGPAVTLLDPATGKTDTFYAPRYEDPAAKALWKPVWDGLRQRLAKKGWDKAMMIASYSDRYPTQREAATLSEVSGGLPWAGCAHHINSVQEDKTLGKVQGIADIGYAAAALDEYYCLNPSKQARCYGWKQSTLYVHYWRGGVFNGPLLTVHYELERRITGNKRGVGHLGADFWPAVRNKAGRRSGIVTDRFPESYWHSLNVSGWMLAPGATGPVGTERLDIFLAGLQECEARIAIETALSDAALKAKLGDELAKRAQDFLDDRLVSIWKGVGVAEADFQNHPLITAYRDWYYDVAKRVDGKAGYKWFLTSNWEDRTAKLYDLAAEVEKKIKER
jgi:hypothetical protein